MGLDDCAGCAGDRTHGPKSAAGIRIWRMGRYSHTLVSFGCPRIGFNRAESMEGWRSVASICNRCAINWYGGQAPLGQDALLSIPRTAGSNAVVDDVLRSL